MKETKAFVARDKNGELYFYSEKPELREDGTFIGPSFVSNYNLLKEVKKGEVKKCKIITED